MLVGDNDTAQHPAGLTADRPALTGFPALANFRLRLAGFGDSSGPLRFADAEPFLGPPEGLPELRAEALALAVRLGLVDTEAAAGATAFARLPTVTTVPAEHPWTQGAGALRLVVYLSGCASTAMVVNTLAEYPGRVWAVASRSIAPPSILRDGMITSAVATRRILDVVSEAIKPFDRPRSQQCIDGSSPIVRAPAFQNRVLSSPALIREVERWRHYASLRVTENGGGVSALPDSFLPCDFAAAAIRGIRDVDRLLKQSVTAALRDQRHPLSLDELHSRILSMTLSVSAPVRKLVSTDHARDQLSRAHAVFNAGVSGNFNSCALVLNVPGPKRGSRSDNHGYRQKP